MTRFVNSHVKCAQAQKSADRLVSLVLNLSEVRTHTVSALFVYLAILSGCNGGTYLFFSIRKLVLLRKLGLRERKPNPEQNYSRRVRGGRRAGSWCLPRLVFCIGWQPPNRVKHHVQNSALAVTDWSRACQVSHTSP